MNSNKIIFFSNQMDTPFNNISGVYNFARLLNLQSLGYEIIIICPITLLPPPNLYNPILFIKYIKEQLSIPLKTTVKGFSIYYPKYFSLPKKISWFSEVFFLHLFCGKKIENIIINYKPDLILTSWLHPFGTYSKYIKKYYNKPYYSYCEGSDVLIFPEKYSGWKKIEHIVNQYVDCVILISKEMEKKVKQKRNLSNTLTIVDGYREDLFYFKNSPKNLSNINLLSVGALLPVKGHDILIKAVSNLNTINSLTIIGGGPEERNLINLVINNQMKDRFKSILYVDQQEINNYINDCNIFCMPSRSDALPAAALEAMACGRPVVACAVGGLKDIINDGFNGFLTNPEDPVDFADGLTRAINHTWNYKEIADWTKSNYGWKKSIDELNTFILNNEK